MTKSLFSLLYEFNLQFFNLITSYSDFLTLIFRTASDLEESGYIDKHQKGIIKDLIISGDLNLQSALDKYEKGDTSELMNLIKQGLFHRHNSIDILDNLDFDFLAVNNSKSELFDDSNYEEHDLRGYIQSIENNARFVRSGSISENFPGNIFNEEVERDKMNTWGRSRNFSLDSTGSANSFRIFDSLPDLLGNSVPFPTENKSSNFMKSEGQKVDLSAYEAVARSLQTKPNANSNRGTRGTNLISSNNTTSQTGYNGTNLNKITSSLNNYHILSNNVSL